MVARSGSLSNSRCGLESIPVDLFDGATIFWLVWGGQRVKSCALHLSRLSEDHVSGIIVGRR